MSRAAPALLLASLLPLCPGSAGLVAGVHTNMCVLNRMYNPKKAPFVSHDQGTELVVQHIEKHCCPTALSRDLLR